MRFGSGTAWCLTIIDTASNRQHLAFGRIIGKPSREKLTVWGSECRLLPSSPPLTWANRNRTNATWSVLTSTCAGGSDSRAECIPGATRTLKKRLDRIRPTPLIVDNHRDVVANARAHESDPADRSRRSCPARTPKAAALKRARRPPPAGETSRRDGSSRELSIFSRAQSLPLNSTGKSLVSSEPASDPIAVHSLAGSLSIIPWSNERQRI